MRGKKIFMVLAVLAVCFAAFAGGSADSGSDTYKIGFIGPLTGDNAIFTAPLAYC